MLRVTQSSTGRLTDDWVGTRATITACDLRLLGRENLSNEGYTPPEYVVSFSYSADGQTFKGTYRANSPQACGRDFEIRYDPKHPSRNTGSDALDKRWVRIAAAALGVTTVLIGIWFWGKEYWFQW
jgi:hypothetical protein